MATEMRAQQHGSLLDEKQRQVAAISMYTSQGDQENLKTALSAGLDAGLTVNETKEILVQLYAYCGFPRGMSALGTLMTVLEERKGKGINDEEGKLPSPLPERNSVEFGAANQRKLFGRDAQGAVLKFAPAIDEYLKAHLFGDIFGRYNLDWQTRELATVAALAVRHGVDNELRAHIGHAKTNGLTDGQINEILAMAQRCENGMALTEAQEPPKTFKADPDIEVRKVFYKNRYDITLVADSPLRALLIDLPV